MYYVLSIPVYSQQRSYTWHRDQVTITIEFADESKEKYDTQKLFKAWKDATKAIAKPLKKLIAEPNGHQNLDYAVVPRTTILTHA
jgi:hypothetical protein